MDGMRGESQRWNGQKSAFSWEQAALDHIRAQMPEAEPYRAWQTFTVTTDRGHVREIDLFIATPGGLFLVEIKSHPGTATNRGRTWLFKDGRVTRTIDNPLSFTDQKAKELKDLLKRAARKLKVKEPIPFIKAAVFLSAENLVCDFSEFQRPGVYGRDNRENQTNLPGIWTGLLNQPPASDRNRVTPSLSRQLPKLLNEIGIENLHRRGKVGSYELDRRSFDSGPTWEDYLARNPSVPNDEPRRVRVYLTERTATDTERESVRRAAYREYMALQGISHEGIVRADEHSNELLAGPAVVFRHGKNWQRLDHFIASTPKDQLHAETRLWMVRQLAEALDHAHRRHLYHRALAPRSVYVEPAGTVLDGTSAPRLKIADWQVAARPNGTRTGASAPHRGQARSSQTRGSTYIGDPNALLQHIELSAGAYLAPEFQNPDAPAALLDVFGLGALSYLILTGEAPAVTRAGLAQRIAADHALVPSSVADAMSAAMDDLVRNATQAQLPDRTESVRAFLKQLDTIEEELTASDQPDEKDPLTALKGDEINGWVVEGILGKGSTSKALLVSQPANDDNKRVFKVGLTDSAAKRLRKEAEELGPLNDSHVARLLEGPFEAGPPGKRRTLIAVEYIEGPTLADELRRHFPLTIHELARLGEDLFQGVTFLDRRQVRHRDIKPGNLVLRKLGPKKGRELVLIDFSLAGTPDTELQVGTRGYLDPFLTDANRGRYDEAAELYAVAVTLHEMASGELPSWGDDMADPEFLADDEEVQLAADLFDPVARDGLTDFFRVALHRDARQRFRSLREMALAWTDIFRDLETVPPLTTSATVDTEDDDGKDVATKRREANEAATATTPIQAAGLSPYALSVAMQRLGVSTAGDLARVPNGRITRLRGIGSVPRFELIRLSSEWKRRFGLTSSGIPRPDVNDINPNSPSKSDTSERSVAAPPGQAPAESEEDLKRLPVDEIVRRLIPGEDALARVTGLAPAQPGADPVSPWASQREIVAATGIGEADVAAHLTRLKKRWAKNGGKALTLVRDDLTEILAAHGRILGWKQLAAGLLAKRGSEATDPEERLVLAAICCRAAVETEERLDSSRMVSRRLTGESSDGSFGTRVLIALRESDHDQDPVPAADELFTFAELLGMAADELSARDPLPGIAEIGRVLRDVPTADHAMRLSDTDLVHLAAAASKKTGATPRLELYPRDLSAVRALKISQVGSIAEGVFEEELVRRVLSRFPDLYVSARPTADAMPDLLRELGYDVVRDSQRKLRIRSSTQLSRSRSRPRKPSTATLLDETARASRRLEQASRRGGFVAVKAPLRDAARIGDVIAGMDGVTGVNVTREFVRLLRDEASKRPKLRWETVLSADSADAPPGARRGFGELLRAVWGALEARIRDAGDGGIVLLHDATPLARYTGGEELLARLAVAARDVGEKPFGLWLLCPMENPKGSPLLDKSTVGVIPGDMEQLDLPEGFGSGAESRAS
ncbi:MAG: BREX system serine/threonine kinase PglW [Nocardiopsaceae bacterium]|nr:BREX system serine/threonine kinase PglW [Nocardiopsaceae bacterium]